MDYSQEISLKPSTDPYVPEINVLVEHLNPFMAKLFATGTEKDLMQ
jgi:hypothetical protein